MKGTVTQPWVHELSFIQQIALLTALRGPDGIRKDHRVKYLQRWLRRCILVSVSDGRIFESPFEEGGGELTGPSFGDPSEAVEFMEGENWWGWMWNLVGEYLQSVDEIPHQFQMHFMHATQILGYKHPDETIRVWWQTTYKRLAADMHLLPETEAQMDERLGDSRDGGL